MAIKRLNHAVLFVGDLERSLTFYREVLGFRVLPGGFAGAAFLQAPGSANDHDLGLFQSPHTDARSASGQVGLYHLAWEVDTLTDLADMRRRLERAGALTGASNHGSTKALYARDPDGIEFEVCWLVPDRHVLDELVPGMPPTRPLDIAAEIERYGADTPSGPRTDFGVWEQLFASRGGAG